MVFYKYFLTIIEQIKRGDSMKLERLSENQIRCTLNKRDLIDRELKLSELAYGTEKAKELFREMMAQASDELGFEADDIPLIIEAIPISGDCIVLIVTKVDDPEELDTRFAKFSSMTDEDTDEDEDEDFEDEEDTSEETEYKGADEILDLFKRISKNLESSLSKTASEAKPEAVSSAEPEAGAKPEEAIEITRIFTFQALSDVTRLASVLKNQYSGSNTLYKNKKTGIYYLVLQNNGHTPDVFNKVCNIATEYGSRENFTFATVAYYEEHYDKIIKNKALQVLADI